VVMTGASVWVTGTRLPVVWVSAVPAPAAASAGAVAEVAAPVTAVTAEVTADVTGSVLVVTEAAGADPDAGAEGAAATCWLPDGVPVAEAAAAVVSGVTAEMAADVAAETAPLAETARFETGVVAAGPDPAPVLGEAVGAGLALAGPLPADVAAELTGRAFWLVAATEPVPGVVPLAGTAVAEPTAAVTCDAADAAAEVTDATGSAEVTDATGEAAGGVDDTAASACRENTSSTTRIPAARIAACIARRATWRKTSCGIPAPAPLRVGSRLT
jgi:hypothetical protein